MTDYTDIPDAHTLHQQREVVTNAIAVLDDGGSLSSMSVVSRPPEPGEMPGAGPMMMMSQIVLPPPTPPDTVAAVRAWLVQRQADLDAQLAAMGVTNPPEAAAAATKGAKR